MTSRRRGILVSLIFGILLALMFMPTLAQTVTVKTAVGGFVTLVPTPINQGSVQILQTSEAEFEATMTAQPTATPIPDPSVSLASGFDRLNVRTGPYLGASLVTVVLRDSTDNADSIENVDSTENVPSYEIMAKSRDENTDVFWYFVTVNGRDGWVSGRSVTVDLNGDGTSDIQPETSAVVVAGEATTEIVETTNEAGEIVITGGEAVPSPAGFDTIPFRGSVFDEIDGAPDLGVTGTLTLARNIHRRPSRRAGVIGSLPDGAQVSIIGRTREISIDDWYHIRVGGTVGWIEALPLADVPAVLVNAELVRDRVPVR